MRIRLWKAVLFLSVVQTTSARQQPIGFEHLTLQDGLSHNSVTCALQDRLGFLWIGTTDGLNRYDGNAFTVFRRNIHDTTSIPDNCILSLCADPDGDVWLGTYSAGLVRYSYRENRFIRYAAVDSGSDAGQSGITALHIDSSGTLWLGTYGTGDVSNLVELWS